MQEDQLQTDRNEQSPHAGERIRRIHPKPRRYSWETLPLRPSMRVSRKPRPSSPARPTLHERLDAAALPAPIKGKLRRRFAGQTFTAEVLEQAIQDEVETVRALTGSANGVHGVGAEKARLSMGGTGARPGSGCCRGRLGAPARRAGHCLG